MDYSDDGRLGQFSIDNHEVFDNIGRDAEHRKLKIAVFGRQSKQIFQRESNDGGRLDRFDVKMRSIDQQQREQPNHSSPPKRIGMDLFAESIENGASKFSNDHEIHVARLGIAFDDNLTGLKLH
jgi:hypothetical protein